MAPKLISTMLPFVQLEALVTLVHAKAPVVAKVAVTAVAAVIDTVHVPVPLQPPPDQPANLDPARGVAVRTTLVPVPNWAEHVAPQSMPTGLEVTVPAPGPATLTVRVCPSWQLPPGELPPEFRTPLRQ